MLSIFSCVCQPSVCFLWRNVYLVFIYIPMAFCDSNVSSPHITQTFSSCLILGSAQAATPDTLDCSLQCFIQGVWRIHLLNTIPYSIHTTQSMIAHILWLRGLFPNSLNYFEIQQKVNWPLCRLVSPQPEYLFSEHLQPGQLILLRFMKAFNEKYLKRRFNTRIHLLYFLFLLNQHLVHVFLI